MEFALAVLCLFVLLFSCFIYVHVLSIFFLLYFYRRCCFDCVIVAFKNIACKKNNVSCSVKLAACVAIIR